MLAPIAEDEIELDEDVMPSVPRDDAVEAEALAQYLRDPSEIDTISELTVSYAVNDAQALREHRVGVVAGVPLVGPQQARRGALCLLFGERAALGANELASQFRQVNRLVDGAHLRFVRNQARRHQRRDYGADHRQSPRKGFSWLIASRDG